MCGLFPRVCGVPVGLGYGFLLRYPLHLCHRSGVGPDPCWARCLGRHPMELRNNADVVHFLDCQSYALSKGLDGDAAQLFGERAIVAGMGRDPEGAWAMGMGDPLPVGIVRAAEFVVYVSTEEGEIFTRGSYPLFRDAVSAAENTADRAWVREGESGPVRHVAF